ncbi:carbonic anhydrase [Lichtheimia corymbifera JMRC:FSU:9682]|uniref:Carbonic anhydrase n=1 Tax=Lichtheimia corymbifera JMRC:FSU:9682 TaxID=1263082 RepID=A0A068RST5_9FUNG|nr:carbonic anhydrase [Lichtheimia corymbifera JMRC:FSU:9682]
MELIGSSLSSVVHGEWKWVHCRRHQKVAGHSSTEGCFPIFTMLQLLFKKGAGVSTLSRTRNSRLFINALLPRQQQCRPFFMFGTDNRALSPIKATTNKFDPSDRHLDGLLKHNREWAKAVKKQEPDFFEQINLKQEPKILWIVFNACDINCLSVIQYAVEVLKVQHIIVCGHYNCGGVAAASGNGQYGLIDNWLRNIKDVYRLHAKELETIQDEKARFRRLVECNAIHSAETICHSTIVQNAWKNNQNLTVHAWVYDLADGHARRLRFIAKDSNSLGNIYKVA